MPPSITRAGSNQFSQRMRFRAEQFKRNATKGIREAATAALEHVVFNTAIDTSKLVSNWTVTIGGPNSEVREAFSLGSKGSTGGASQIATLSNGRGIIETYVVGRGADLYISNATPYLRFNNSGQLADASDAARRSLKGMKLFK